MAFLRVQESAHLFQCEDEELVGIVSLPEVAMTGIGVLIVVGGPQYRAGSHRQFVLLARALAREGVPCMRFDYRGMGDATGHKRDFESVDADMRAAVDVFHSLVPGLSGVVLWGLCDGATAATFYASRDPRVRALMLLNPWVKTAAGQARTYLKHYYLKRLWSREFWLKLLKGGVALRRSLSEVQDAVSKVRSGKRKQYKPGEAGPLPDRFRQGLARAAVPWKVVLSGRDYVAREFEQVAASEEWAALSPMEHVVRIAGADHTFSSAAWRNEVADTTLKWVRGLNAADRAD